MLLSNRHIEVTIGILLGKSDHVRAFAHGRGNTYQAWFLVCHFHQPATKYIGIA